MMDIEEAIKHCKEVAKRKCGLCASEHEQLAKWLEELLSLRKKNKFLEDELFRIRERCYELDRKTFISKIENENIKFLSKW